MRMSNCSNLEFLGDFNDYISFVRSETNFSETILLQCQRQICFAIWGEGNPDISGIGVSIGYGFEVALGFGLAAAILAVQARKRQTQACQFLERVLRAAFDAFFDCAIYFALAVELASVVMLAQKDFGLSTRGFGASDAQITLANSVVCILPLLYPVALGFSSRSSLPPVLLSPSSSSADLGVVVARTTSLMQRSGSHPESATEIKQQAQTGEGQPTSKQQKEPVWEQPQQDDHTQSEEQLNSRRNFHLLLFCVLTILFFYPFISQCIHNWAPSRIGDSTGPGGATVATDAEWSKIVNLCFGDVRQFSDTETLALAVFELLGALAIYLFTLWHVTVVGVHNIGAEDEEAEEERKSTAALRRTKERLEGLWKHSKFATGVLLLTPLALTMPLLWGIFRLRDIQGEVVNRMGSQYTGNEWGFGQIIGVVIFAPVVTEAGFASWKHFSLLKRNSHDR